jgi:hypothetical protein
MTDYLKSAVTRAIDEYNEKNSVPKYPLTCGHYFRTEAISPILGDVVYCRICDDYATVRRTKTNRRYGKQPNRPRTRVECKDCKFVRSYPTTYIASIRGQSHAIRLTHTVWVIPPEVGAKIITLTSQGP